MHIATISTEIFKPSTRICVRLHSLRDCCRYLWRSCGTRNSARVTSVAFSLCGKRPPTTSRSSPAQRCATNSRKSFLCCQPVPRPRPQAQHQRRSYPQPKRPPRPRQHQLRDQHQGLTTKLTRLSKNTDLVQYTSFTLLETSVYKSVLSFMFSVYTVRRKFLHVCYLIPYMNIHNHV